MTSGEHSPIVSRTMGLITLSRNFVYWTQSWKILTIIAWRRSFLWRSLWNVVLVGTLAAFTFQSVQLVQDYLRYQRTTNIQLFYEPQTTFPAVTVCNLNPFKASKVNESEALQTLLNAYAYVVQKKQQSQAAASSSGGLAVGKRRRRQTGGEGKTIDCPVKEETDSTSGYSYQRYDCTNGTSILRFLVCPDTDPRPYDSQWFARSDLDAFQTDLVKAFYRCLERDVCSSSQCSKYNSGLDMLTKLHDCAANQVCLSPYPPAAGSNNVIAVLAQTVAGKCGFSDADCHLGTYKKPSTTYPGNYVYKACPADSTKTTYTLTISIDSCNNGAPIKNTHTYNENTCKYPNYIDTMVQRVSSALDASQCFANCTAPCAYNEADSCQGALYEDLLCQIQSGNGTCTTSTSLWSTTPMESTVPSTTTGTSNTTTTAGATTSTPNITDIATTTITATTSLDASSTTEDSTVGSMTTQTTTLKEPTTPLLTSTSDVTMPQATDITTSMDATTLEATTTTEASTAGPSTAGTTTIMAVITPLLTSPSALSSSISTLSLSTTTVATSTIPTTSSSTEMVISTTKAIDSTKSSTTVLTTPPTTKTTASTTPESGSTSTPASTTTATAAETANFSASLTSTTTTVGQSSSNSTPDVTSTTTTVTTSSVPADKITTGALTTSITPKPSAPTSKETSTASVAVTPLTATADATSTLVPSTTIITFEERSSRRTTAMSEGPESTISTTTSSTISPTSTTDLISTNAISATSSSTDLIASEALTTSNTPSPSASTSDNGASTSTTPRTTEEITSQSGRKRSSTPLPSTSTTILSLSTVEARTPSGGTSSTASSRQRTLTVSSIVEVSETSAIRTTADTVQSSSTGGVSTTSSTEASTSTTATTPAGRWDASIPSSHQLPFSRTSTGTAMYSTTTVVVLQPTTYATGKTVSTTGSHPGSTASMGVMDDKQTSAHPLPSTSSVPTQTSTTGASATQSSTGTHTMGANSDASTESTKIPSLVSSTTSATSSSTKVPLTSSTYPSVSSPTSRYASLVQSSTHDSAALSSATAFSTQHDFDGLPSLSTGLPGTVSTAGIDVPAARTPTLGDHQLLTTPTHIVPSTGVERGISASITSRSSSLTTGGTQNGPANTAPGSSTESTNDRSGSSHSTRASVERVTQSGKGLLTVDKDLGRTAKGLVSKTIATTPKAQPVPSSALATASAVNPANASDCSSDSDEEKTATTAVDSAASTTLLGSEDKIPANFNISDLTPNQVQLLDDVADVYGLNPNDSMPTIEANLLQAMIVVASRMTQAERDKLGFTLRDLVSSCIIDREPCDMDNDFQQTFDVNYGNCYTFNYAYQPEVVYVTKRTGSASGLKMTVFSNSSEYLASSSTQGIKVLVHTQETQPFPNVQGYMASVGSQTGIVVANNKFARLGEPYSNCSTLESLAATNQPFYYNGSYSIEGCFRSCFQHKIISACGCADSRFPLPEEDGIEYCTPLDDTQRTCYVDYIAKHGDYYSVANCSCYEPCKDSVYSVRMFVADWPTGDFFYGGLCPKARRLSSADCAEYYRENSATVEVYFAQLGYRLLEERPRTTIPGLIRNMAGNTGLWIGLSVASVGEFILCGVQILLWLCTKTKELPEVPSCRRRNYTFKGGDDNKEEDDDRNPAKSDRQNSSEAECIPVAQISSFATLPFADMFDIPEVAARHRLSPKGFPNCHERAVYTPRVRAGVPHKDADYERQDAVKLTEHSAKLVPPAVASEVEAEKPAFE